MKPENDPNFCFRRCKKSLSWRSARWASTNVRRRWRHRSTSRSLRNEEGGRKLASRGTLWTRWRVTSWCSHPAAPKRTVFLQPPRTSLRPATGGWFLRVWNISFKRFEQCCRHCHACFDSRWRNIPKSLCPVQ